MQLIRRNTLNDTIMLSSNTFFVSQTQTLINRQNQENELEIDDKDLDLPFPYNYRLCRVEKSDKIKLHRRSSGSFNKKKSTCKEKKFQ